jgi:hypothetical protein
MKLALEATPDEPTIKAATFGPVVLSGAYGDRAFMPMPRLDPDSIKPSDEPLVFEAKADGEAVRLLPIFRTHHQHYNVYWRTAPPPPPPPEFAVWHPFDETSGTVAADATGHGKAATLVGGASWTAGRIGGAVALDGANGSYVALADGVVNGATAYSVATWVRIDALSTWSRIFDFGTGTSANMFLTPRSGSGTLRYAITAGGSDGEQQINVPVLPTGVWKHVAVTYADGVGVLYVDGAEAGRNASMQVVPLWFADEINQNYIGKSQYADPYLKGAIDDFRIYGRALSAAEVGQLASG